MKVLMINTVPLAYNGISTCVLNFSAALASDINVHIVAPMGVPDDIQENLADAGITLYQLPNRKENLKSYIVALFRLLRKEHYDVVHIHGNSATMTFELLPAFLCGIKKRIAHCHTTKCEHQKTHKLLLPLFSLLYTSGLACSKQAGDWIFGRKKFAVLNNAFVAADYAFDPSIRQAYRQSLGLDDSALVLGHIGHFSESKNQAFLVELVKDLPANRNIKLLLIGVGDMEDEIKARVDLLGLQDRILFLGTRTDIPALLNAMDLFLLPSKWEGLGIVLLEAQLTGLTCIASSEVPTAASLAGEVTFLPLDDPEAWKQIIVNFIKMDNRSHLSDVARKAATEKGFDIAAEADKLRHIYCK